MDKGVLKRLIVQSQERSVDLVKRDVGVVFEGKVNVIVGPRRAGKTFLVFQLIQELRERGLKDRVLYINFEDERLWPVRSGDLSLILDAYFELFPENRGKKIFLFLDEVQVVPLWEKFVRRLSEEDDFEITLTGSSSKLLSREIATELRGRSIDYFVFPFSFKEFLVSRGVVVGRNFEFEDVLFMVKKLLGEFVLFGGFPEVVGQSEVLKVKTLQSYYELIFYKDVIERFKVRNYGVLRELMHFLLTNSSNLFSLNKFFNYLKARGERVSKDTLSEYVSFLSDVNFVFFVPKFSYSLKEQMMNPKKVYCIDTGLINAVSFKFSDNFGRLYENVVFIELKRRNYNNFLSEFFYWKGKFECDFLVKKGNEVTEAIQVVYDLSEENKKREVGGLVEALEEFGLNEGLIITNDYEGIEEVKGKKIRFVPLWKWLLRSGLEVEE